MKKILVTGGAGFIGSALAEKLISDKENTVIIVDNLSTGNFEKLPKLPKTNWNFIKCDVNEYSDISKIMLSYKFDYVFHYAATVGVKRTQENPVSVLNDVKGIENILNISKTTGVKRLYFSSSSEIYGEPVEMPQHEHTTPLNSRIPYAIVKNLGEAFLRSYHQKFGIEFTIFRFFNTYGHKQRKDFVIIKFLKQALDNKTISIYGDGQQTRTFCYIDDNIDACFNAYYKNEIVNDVANIGGNEEITIIDLANLIIKITNSKSKIVHVDPLKEGDMRKRCPDNTKMLKLLGRNMLSLENGIKKILEKDLVEI